MNQLVSQLGPELVLVTVACVLFLLGVFDRAAVRRAAPLLAVLTLLGIFGYELREVVLWSSAKTTSHGADGVLHITLFAHYIKLISAGVGVLLLLLAWPTNDSGTGNSALNFGKESGEFFALMLLSICGIFLVASANDIMLLFLGIELASIPTYIMVSISRPLPVAQEAGVKYFFLGALAAALMLFGFSYLYGVTGQTNLLKITATLHPTADASATLGAWPMLAMVMLLAGFAFKIAAVPMHVYAGDVYQGAATPVTAFLSFVPKASGFVAILKMLAVLGGSRWVFPPEISRLMWVLAVLTMTFGNVLGLLQYNIKRLLAYSSIAHSGYMLVGVAALTSSSQGILVTHLETCTQALGGILFYLTAYGIMNAAAFGVLMMLPARRPRAWESRFTPIPPAESSAASAETFEDIAGQGRHNVGLGLAMTVACFSLIGIPLTVGFFGKFLLIVPTFTGGLYGLTIILVINAAISAAYYLKIVGTLFLRSDDLAAGAEVPAVDHHGNRPVAAAIAISVLGTLLLGIFLPATSAIQSVAQQAASDLNNQPVAAPAHAAVPDR